MSNSIVAAVDSTAPIEPNVNDLFEMSKHMTSEQFRQAMSAIKQIANGDTPSASTTTKASVPAVNSAQQRSDFLLKYLATFLKPWMKLSEELHLENDKTQPINTQPNSCAFRTRQKYQFERPKLESIMCDVITPAVTQMFGLSMDEWSGIRAKCLEKRPASTKSKSSAAAAAAEQLPSKKRKQTADEQQEQQQDEDEEAEQHSSSNQSDEDDAMESSPPPKPKAKPKTAAATVPAAVTKKRSTSINSSNSRPPVVTTTTSIINRSNKL